MKITRQLLAGAAALTLVAGVAAAQSTPNTETQNKSTARRTERTERTEKKGSANRLPTQDKFFSKAAEGGMAEVQMGQLAVKSGSNSDVKQFGQRMIDDHTKANQQLKDIAAKQHVNLPDSPSSKQQAEIDRLSKLNGKQFDQAYMQAMVKDHKQDVAEFEREAKNAQDPELKQFAQSTLPTLKEHLQKAEQVQNELKK